MKNKIAFFRNEKTGSLSVTHALTNVRGIKIFTHTLGQNDQLINFNGYKATIIRNPWDRLLSWYFWKNKDQEQLISFSEWVINNNDDLKNRCQLQYTHHNNKVYTNFIGRFENLQIYFNILCCNIRSILQNFDLHMPLMHENKNNLDCRKPYYTFFSEKDLETIRYHLPNIEEEADIYGYKYK